MGCSELRWYSFFFPFGCDRQMKFGNGTTVFVLNGLPRRALNQNHFQPLRRFSSVVLGVFRLLYKSMDKRWKNCTEGKKEFLFQFRKWFIHCSKLMFIDALTSIIITHNRRLRMSMASNRRTAVLRNRCDCTILCDDMRQEVRIVMAPVQNEFKRSKSNQGTHDRTNQNILPMVMVISNASVS